MDVDATQAQKEGRRGAARDKAGVTCFNCGKKGHFKRDCRSAKKDWEPVPGKEAATIDKHVRTVEVAAAGYAQDDSDVGRANAYEQALADAETSTKDENLETDDRGEVAPPSRALETARLWRRTLAQNNNGQWRIRNAGEQEGRNIAYLQKRVIE
ncbi:hypothetical protein N657DRAFT_629177, partial [Parathielavia appendiculata]